MSHITVTGPNDPAGAAGRPGDISFEQAIDDNEFYGLL
jgi:hypothetical protein